VREDNEEPVGELTVRVGVASWGFSPWNHSWLAAGKMNDRRVVEGIEILPFEGELPEL